MSFKTKTALLLYSFFLFFSVQLLAQDHALVIADAVRLRAEKNTNSKTLAKLDLGTVVEIVAIDPKRSFLPGSSEAEQCEAYHWVQVKSSFGEIGWIYGQFLQSFEKENPISSFTLKGENYDMYLGKYLGVPAMDDDGPIFCDEYQIPFLLKKGGGDRAELLLDKTKLYTHFNGYGYKADMRQYRGKFWMLEHSSGLIQELEPGGIESMGNWLMDMHSYGQESYKTNVVIEISIDSYDRVIVEGISYQNATKY